MNISAKTEYACLAVLELAIHYGSGEPVRIRTIADTHGVPSRFLVQILLQLKGAGLVRSTRGAAGGYQLVKDPSQVSLGSVMGLIEGGAELASNAGNPTDTSRALMDAWKEVNQVQIEMLSSISFSDLVERVQGASANMYYI